MVPGHSVAVPQECRAGPASGHHVLMAGVRRPARGYPGSCPNYGSVGSQLHSADVLRIFSL